MYKKKKQLIRKVTERTNLTYSNVYGTYVFKKIVFFACVAAYCLGDSSTKNLLNINFSYCIKKREIVLKFKKQE